MSEELRKWEAKWIWPEGLPRSNNGEHELAYFRRTFILPDNSTAYKLIVRVTADSRYRLYLNGESVSVGPCKGDYNTHYYETVDLSGRLRPGHNVLAAKVLHYASSDPFVMGKGGPISVWRSDAGGFLLEGKLQAEDGTVIDNLKSDENWLCRKSEGYAIVSSPMMQWLGGLEHVEANCSELGWEQLSFDDSGWIQAIPFYGTRNDFGELAFWKLAPRSIPALFEHWRSFSGVVKASGVERATVQQFLLGEGELTIPAGHKVAVELDAGTYTTGYPRIAFTHGGNSVIKMICAECYEHPDSKPYRRLKGVRDEAEGGILVGDPDVYRPAGVEGTGELQEEYYEPFWFRTFRYVRLEIETMDTPLVLRTFAYRETGYPLEVKGSFSCSDDRFNRLWELSLNTLQRCIHETYEDCPYYEQLQYTMDTRMQMLYTYHLTRDDRLAQKAIFDYHSSQLPSGMLQCRYPSVFTQVIPAFSIYWILMLSDHYQYFGDVELIRRYRGTAASLLGWFERLLTPEGIVGETPPAYWTHFDWVKDWVRGAPPAFLQGPVTLHSLMYSVALQRTADLFEISGWPDAASEYREQAKRVNEAVRKTCYSADKGMFRDGPQVEEFCQHTQIWAIMADAVDAKEAGGLMSRTLEDQTLGQVSLPMAHFLFRTLDRMGRYDLAAGQWERWKVFLDLHLTTLPEQAHDVPRSDCHAWSAQPLAEFPMAILGVQPAEPGFAAIRIKPNPLHLNWARGVVPTIRGDVSVEWHAAGGKFDITVSGPADVPVTIDLPDGTSRTVKQAEGLTISCAISELPEGNR